MNWYYAERGQQMGPVTEEQFGEMVSTGQIRPETLVWRDGMAAWVAYRELQTPSSGSGAAPATAPAFTPGFGPEAVCAECKQLFAIQDMIRHGNAYVCAGCKPIFLQKLAEGARIDTGLMNYAGFWIRFAAKFVDGLILGLPFAIIFALLVIPTVRSGSNSSSSHASPLPEFLPLLIQFGFLGVRMVYEIFFLGRYGATPGKMACKLKVVTAEGQPIGYGRAAARFFAEILSGMLCYIGYLIVAFDSQKRALHDYICNTRVVIK